MTKAQWEDLKEEVFIIGNLRVIPNYKRSFRKLSASVYEDLCLLLLQNDTSKAKNFISNYREYFIVKEII